MALRVLAISVDSLTGHTSAQVRVEDADGTIGPPETVGIDHLSLLGQYHDPAVAPSESTVADAITKWLSVHHSSALARKRALDVTTMATTRMKGTLLSF